MTITYILFGIIAVLIIDRAYSDYRYQGMIDRLQDRLMAKDYPEYARSQTGSTGTVTNPLMQRIKTQYERRNVELSDDN